MSLPLLAAGTNFAVGLTMLGFDRVFRRLGIATWWYRAWGVVAVLAAIGLLLLGLLAPE